MKWQNKDIKDLDDYELIDAVNKINSMNFSHIEIRKTTKYLDKFKNQIIPPINPAFLELHQTVNEEMHTRNLIKLKF